MAIHTAHSKQNFDESEQRKREIAISLLTQIPESFDAASQQLGYTRTSSLKHFIDRDDPSFFLRKYGGELATDERIEQIRRAFQAYRRVPGKSLQTLGSLRYPRK